MTANILYKRLLFIVLLAASLSAACADAAGVDMNFINSALSTEQAALPSLFDRPAAAPRTPAAVYPSGTADKSFSLFSLKNKTTRQSRNSSGGGSSIPVISSGKKNLSGASAGGTFSTAPSPVNRSSGSAKFKAFQPPLTTEDEFEGGLVLLDDDIATYVDAPVEDAFIFILSLCFIYILFRIKAARE